MNNQKYSLKLIIAFLTSFVCCYTISLPLVVQAKPPVSPAPAQKKPPVSPAPAKQEPFTPVDTGKPKKTHPAGRRNDCMMGEKSLTALIPVTPKKPKKLGLGLTLASRPTLFFYIPQTKAKDADLSLQDEKGNFIYKNTIKLPKTSGVISLPILNIATSRELQVNKSYQWTFSLVCNAQNRADDMYVQGFIQRVSRPKLVAKVEKTALKQRPSLYAEAGIWHEMLTTLAELRRANPNDAALTAEWRSFLESVGLKDVAQEPFVSETLTSLR